MIHNQDVGLKFLREERKNKAAIVFIHGFTGQRDETWSNFTPFILSENRLQDWDVCTFGYSSNKKPDIAGIWSSDADIDTIAKMLLSFTREGSLKRYDALALVCHSMGGLVAQHAIVSDHEFALKISHLFMFGTPSRGLEKVNWVHRLKRQIKDMMPRGAFITNLRTAWSNQTTIQNGFHFTVIAGENDEFVPRGSSLFPFPSHTHRVTPGNHLSMIRCNSASDLPISLVVTGITSTPAWIVPKRPSQRAILSNDFRQLVDRHINNIDNVDDDTFVEVVLALDELGERDQAVQYLLNKSIKSGNTDIMGVHAGRLKRTWQDERSLEHAEKAIKYYHKGMELALAVPNKPDFAQAYYHGINYAYLLLCYQKNVDDAKEMALRVLEYCEQAPDSYWCKATQGEAFLILEKNNKAIKAFKSALLLHHEKRHLGSTYRQLLNYPMILKNNKLRTELQELFEVETP